MGLDMYLNGRNFIANRERPKVDGVDLKEQIYELGYWRKHPNLHGYIVKTFANGVDECQEIFLTKENVEKILYAIEYRELPHTTGFFFGKSDGTEKDEDIKIFKRALEWLEKGDKDNWRSIFYQASW